MPVYSMYRAAGAVCAPIFSVWDPEHPGEIVYLLGAPLCTRALVGSKPVGKPLIESSGIAGPVARRAKLAPAVQRLDYFCAGHAQTLIEQHDELEQNFRAQRGALLDDPHQIFSSEHRKSGFR